MSLFPVRGNEGVPQKPVSRPTAKQLLSWLKITESDTGPVDSSIAGRVFMTASPEDGARVVDAWIRSLVKRCRE